MHHSPHPRKKEENSLRGHPRAPGRGVPPSCIPAPDAGSPSNLL